MRKYWLARHNITGGLDDDDRWLVAEIAAALEESQEPSSPPPGADAGAREPRTHELKCWPKYFTAVIERRKPFEVRVNDRDYRVFDVLRLREWQPTTREYTGRYCHQTVIYVMPGGRFGLISGSVVLGLAGTWGAASVAREAPTAVACVSCKRPVAVTALNAVRCAACLSDAIPLPDYAHEVAMGREPSPAPQAAGGTGEGDALATALRRLTTFVDGKVRGWLPREHTNCLIDSGCAHGADEREIFNELEDEVERADAAIKRASVAERSGAPSPAGAERVEHVLQNAERSLAENNHEGDWTTHKVRALIAGVRDVLGAGAEDRDR